MPGTDHPLTCPACGATAQESELRQTDYRCAGCGLELAHLDTAPNGVVRGLLSWLRAPGDLLLDRYRIIKALGKGGFAAVYLAEDLRVNHKQRAIKEIPEDLFDPTEVELLALLHHPAIPDIIDQGRAGGMVYLVMEFGGDRTLEGERKRRGGQIPWPVLWPWLRQLGAVLTYLHNQSPPIVHRDLKPDNILLDDQDRIMLIDFGIAKASATSERTRTLARAASLEYSSPEQALGAGTDPRSDVYALAAATYALVTGRRPEPAYQRVAGTELTPPTRWLAELPESLNDTLLQALNLNVNQRPSSVEVFLRMIARDVTDATGPLPDPAGPTSMTQRLQVVPGANPVQRATGGRARTWLGLGLVALTVGAGAWWVNEGRQSGGELAPPGPVATLVEPAAVESQAPAEPMTAIPEVPPVQPSLGEFAIPADNPPPSSAGEWVLVNPEPAPDASPVPEQNPASAAPIIPPWTEGSGDGPVAAMLRNSGVMGASGSGTGLGASGNASQFLDRSTDAGYKPPPAPSSSKAVVVAPSRVVVVPPPPAPGPRPVGPGRPPGGPALPRPGPGPGRHPPPGPGR